jgi:hypothetical protein
VQEERRFCFEVKTKNQTILVQSETQGSSWNGWKPSRLPRTKLSRRAQTTILSYPSGVDPAFAITPPSIPEFAAKSVDGNVGHVGDDLATGAFDRTTTLPIPGPETGNLASRSSFDVTAPRRSVTTREEGESSRDHAARIMQKLDLHRKSTIAQSDAPAAPAPVAASGGIASLISASHNILPVYSTPAITQVGPNVAIKTSNVTTAATRNPYQHISTCYILPTRQRQPT